MQKRNMIVCMVLMFLAGAGLTFVIIITIFKISSEKSGEELVIGYGDSFVNVPILDWNGKRVDISKERHEYTFVYYLDKSCSTCIDSLEVINHICKVYTGMNVSNMIIWEEEIGSKHTQKYGIPNDINFFLKDTHISISTPAFYILDKDFNVIFVAHTMEDMLTKICLLDISNKKMVNEKYISRTFNGSKKEKPILVYFSMIGCPDCELTNPIVESSDIQELFQVVTLYRDRDNVPKEFQNSIDYGGLLAKIYEIDWYPSFLILHNSGEYEVIGETNSAEIKDKLLSHVY